MTISHAADKKKGKSGKRRRRGHGSRRGGEGGKDRWGGRGKVVIRTSGRLKTRVGEEDTREARSIAHKAEVVGEKKVGQRSVAEKNRSFCRAAAAAAA